VGAGTITDNHGNGDSSGPTGRISLAGIVPGLAKTAWSVQCCGLPSCSHRTSPSRVPQVMMDLLKPKRYNGEVDEYKLQFSFNGAVSSVAVAA
jgi:hypothetical protein